MHGGIYVQFLFIGEVWIHLRSCTTNSLIRWTFQTMGTTGDQKRLQTLQEAVPWQLQHRHWTYETDTNHPHQASYLLGRHLFRPFFKRWSTASRFLQIWTKTRNQNTTHGMENQSRKSLCLSIIWFHWNTKTFQRSCTFMFWNTAGWLKGKIQIFKTFFLFLPISVTPKLHAVFYHVREFVEKHQTSIGILVNKQLKQCIQSSKFIGSGTSASQIIQITENNFSIVLLIITANICNKKDHQTHFSELLHVSELKSSNYPI